MKRSPEARLLPRLRVMRGSTILLGPGKGDLLEAIDRLRSIRDAARGPGVSYMRAGNLVQTMNDGFREPLVIVHRGGSEHGGAVLTDTGRAALRLYRTLESDTLDATKPTWTKLRKLFRDT